MAIAIANSLRDQARMEGELAELNQVRVERCLGLDHWGGKVDTYRCEGSMGS